MLQAEQIKPFINHPERAVKNFTVEYFSGSYNQDADLLPLVLQSVTAAPLDPDNEMRLTQAKRFTQTNATVAELFRRLKADADDFAYEYNELLVHCDLELLAAFPDEQTLLHQATQGQLAIRKRLAQFSTEHLWAEFQRYGAKKLDDDYNFDCDEDDNEDYEIWLIKELVKRPDFSLDTVMACLNTQFVDDDESFMELYLCELVGELKLDAGLSFLLRCLAKENELLNEAASEALAKLGTLETVQELEMLYMQGTPDFRIYTAGTLMNIKSPEAEAALSGLLHHETDPMIAAILAAGLCNLLSVKAIPLVREMIYQGYERDMVCLEEKLYVNCLINGKELPEMPKWSELIAENFAEYDSWDDERNHDAACDCDDCDCHCDEYDDGYEEAPDDGAEVKEWDAETDNSTRPQVEQRSVIKIGRNDPCPCGSGKKYKKCCLGK